MRNPHKLPRKAYCNGCDFTFPKMHLLRNHRIGDRCGGRFLPIADRMQINKIRKAREDLDREMQAIRKAAERR